MGIEQILQNEVYESQRALNGPNDDTIYRRDHSKRIELINWVLDNMENPDVAICSIIESRMNETTQEINQTHSIFQSDKLHSELRILDWIFYQVCINQQQSSKKELK